MLQHHQFTRLLWRRYNELRIIHVLNPVLHKKSFRIPCQLEEGFKTRIISSVGSLLYNYITRATAALYMHNEVNFEHSGL